MNKQEELKLIQGLEHICEVLEDFDKQLKELKRQQQTFESQRRNQND